MRYPGLVYITFTIHVSQIIVIKQEDSLQSLLKDGIYLFENKAYDK